VNGRSFLPGLTRILFVLVFIVVTYALGDRSKIDRRVSLLKILALQLKLLRILPGNRDANHRENFPVGAMAAIGRSMAFGNRSQDRVSGENPRSNRLSPRLPTLKLQ
jgi:hypothetical protein